MNNQHPLAFTVIDLAPKRATKTIHYSALWMLATESVLALSGIKHKYIKGPVFSRHDRTAQIHACPPSQLYFCSNKILFSF